MVCCILMCDWLLNRLARMFFFLRWTVDVRQYHITQSYILPSYLISFVIYPAYCLLLWLLAAAFNISMHDPGWINVRLCDVCACGYECVCVWPILRSLSLLPPLHFHSGQRYPLQIWCIAVTVWTVSQNANWEINIIADGTLGAKWNQCLLRQRNMWFFKRMEYLICSCFA